MPGVSRQDSAGQLEQLRDGVRLLALGALGDAALADEVAQDTLSRAYMVLCSTSGNASPSNLEAYVLGIARNVISTTITGRVRELNLLKAYARVRERPRGPLQRLVDEEQAGRVRTALGRLSPTDRETLYLAFYEGLKPREIAERLGEPAGRVRKRKSRALARLRRAYVTPEDAETQATCGAGRT